jgi:hypothetical protein
MEFSEAIPYCLLILCYSQQIVRMLSISTGNGVSLATEQSILNEWHERLRSERVRYQMHIKQYNFVLT